MPTAKKKKVKKLDPKFATPLKKVARELESARKKEGEVWTKAQEIMREIHGTDGGPTFAEIAAVFGITKARVYQIVTGNRGGKKDITNIQSRKPSKAAEKSAAVG